ASTPSEKRRAARDHREAQPLTHGEAEREEADEGVGLAEELGEEAQAAVTQQEHGGNLPRRPRLRREPPQEGEQHQAFQPELIELRRVARLVAGARELHAPW